MHQASVRVHHNPENTGYGIGPSISAANSIPVGTNGHSSYPNVSVGSNMNCGTEVNTLSEELRAAVEDCQSERVIELLKRGAPSVLDAEGQTPLHLAAASGNLELVDALIQAGCDVTVQDFTGHTALQRAAAEGHVPVIKTLLENGVSVDHQDEVHGNTALHESSWKGFSQSVSVLCKAKANAYIKNRGGFAPLHLCCQNGHNETCRVLLLAGCKPDIKNNYGDTPLHTSARYGHAGVIRILVSAKCNPSEQNKNGDTALHIAAAMGRRKLTRVLLESGCSQGIKNKQHETALEIARRKSLMDIIKIIENPPSLLIQPRLLQVSGGEGRSSREGPNINDDLLNDTTLNHDFDPDDLDDQEEDVDGIRRDPSYPYHPCPDTSKGNNKNPDPHQKYHHYNSYNLQSSRREAKSKNIRSSDSSKENLKRNNGLPKNSHVPSQQKRQRNLPNEGKYFHKTAEGFDSVPRKRDSRQFETRNVSRRQHTRNMEQNTKRRSKEVRKSTFIQSPYHEDERGETKHLGQEKNNGLIKNHTKLMDQIMDDLVAEATDNEGQYYLDLAGNVRKDITQKKRRDVTPRVDPKACRCANAFSKIEKRLANDKGELIRHIDQSQNKLESKLVHLERKTRDQLFGLNQAMKESLAAERGECLDRMDRRALRERMAIERQQVLRDVALKRDLAVWLDARLTEIEKRHNLDAKNAALLRTMAVKRFSKYKKSSGRGRSLETGIGNSSPTMRRSHSEEMLSELELNLVGSSSANGEKMDTKKPSQKVSGSTTNKKLPKHHQNGEPSSTELEEEDDMSQYRYKHHPQALCVSDLPRMIRNSDHGGTSSQSMNLPQPQQANGETLGSYSLQYLPHQNFELDRNQDLRMSNEFQQMSIRANGNSSSNTASPLATSEQMFMSNGSLLATNSTLDKSGLYMNGSVNETNHHPPGLIDVETTQLNPELYSLQSNDDTDVMMTSSASLHLHHLHQYNQNQNLEVSSRPNNLSSYYNTSANELYTNHSVSGSTDYKDNVISPEKRLDFVVSSACEVAAPMENNHHINSTDSSFSHNYNNVSFARSNNNVCSINYFSNLEDLNNTNNGLLKNEEPTIIANNEYDHTPENSILSSHGSYGQRQINTIQMVRPIPKFTTFGNGNQASISAKNDYFPVTENTFCNGYGSQGLSLPKGIHSGSEEDLHRALPIYLPSEGESTSSLSCTSVNDIPMGHGTESNLFSHLNIFDNLNLLNDDPMCYRQQLIDATQRQLSQYGNISSNNESALLCNDLPSSQRVSSSTNSSILSKISREELQTQHHNKPPPLPARLHPPPTTPHQQQSPNSLTFFPPVVHQFPGRSVKTMLAPLDEGDYSPVDEDNTAHSTESQTLLIGKVQKTAEKFNNLINTQKMSKTSTSSNDKEITSKSIDSEMSSNVTNNLEVQNGKNLKDLINGSTMDNVGDSGIGQLSSNSLSGTSVSGSISSSNSSSSTSPQDSHNDSGYSTRVGYSAGPSPSLSVSRPQSSEGEHSHPNPQQNGFSIPVAATAVAEVMDKRKQLDGSISDSGLLIDQLGIDLTQSELQQIHSTSDSALMSLCNEKGITNVLNSASKVNSNMNVFQSIKIDSNGYGPRGSLV